jgi:hypothetical protein
MVEKIETVTIPHWVQNGNTLHIELSVRREDGSTLYKHLEIEMPRKITPDPLPSDPRMQGKL